MEDKLEEIVEITKIYGEYNKNRFYDIAAIYANGEKKIVAKGVCGNLRTPIWYKQKVAFVLEYWVRGGHCGTPGYHLIAVYVKDLEKDKQEKKVLDYGNCTVEGLEFLEDGKKLKIKAVGLTQDRKNYIKNEIIKDTE